MTRSDGHIFLSYSRPNRAIAAALAAELARCGWKVWWDREILPGHQYDKVIAQQLKDAACVVVLWSSDAIDSPYVRDEARHALRRDVLVPALIENVDPPLGFGEHHTASLVGWQGNIADDQLEMLKRGIAQHLKPVLKAGFRDASSPPPLDSGQRSPFRSGDPSIGSPRLFICHRRCDSIELAAELCRALADTYGTEAVSTEVAGNSPLDTQSQQDPVLPVCRAVLVVIGPSWSSVTDGSGNRKLDHPRDHVRREIAAAIRQRLPLIPILVDGAQFPPPEILPDDIRALCHYDRWRLSGLSLKRDIESVIRKLDPVMNW